MFCSIEGKTYFCVLDVSVVEGERLILEEATLVEVEIDGLIIKFRGLPTLVDGKVRTMWSDMKKKAMSRCFLCEAGPKELSKKRGKFKCKYVNSI